MSSRRRHPVRRPLLGVPDWLVGEVGDTSFKGLGGEEAHGFRSAGLAEETLTGPEHDREDVQPQLVDLVVLEQRAYELEAGGDDEVPAQLLLQLFGAGRRFDLVGARANGQPAFGAYLRAPDGIHHGTGLYVLTLTGDQICAMTRFDNSVLPWFGLPRSLPD